MPTWNVSHQQIQLLAFLKEVLKEQVSGKQIKKWLDDNLCQVNGRVERFGSSWLGKGDVVTFSFPKQTILPIQTEIEILYQDEDVIACNKPAGLISESDFLPKSIKAENSLILLHRLDKDTSGVLLFAKHAKAEVLFLKLFKERQIKKKYLAIVDQNPSQKEGLIANYLGKLKSYQGQAIWGSVPVEKGLRAVTRWVRKAVGKRESLLECYPLTGRTHQLRVHLSEMGHPILGDFQYGKNFKSVYRPERQMLHAFEIEFQHPIKNTFIKITSPLPQDFLEALKELFHKESIDENFNH